MIQCVPYRILALLLAVALFVVSVPPTVGAGEVTAGKYRYQLLGDGTAEITGYTEYGVQRLVIPEKIQGYTVTGLGSALEYDIGQVTELQIPDTVVYIPGLLFEGTPWYHAQPDGLVYVGKVCYRYKGTMPADTALTLKAGTKAVATRAFYDCEALVSVVLPSSVEVIGSVAFGNCLNLVTVRLPAGLRDMEWNAFEGCTAVKEVTLPGNHTAGVKYLFRDAYRVIEKAAVATGSTQVAPGLFEYADKLTRVTLSEGVSTIGASAFARCSGLKTVILPSSVREIQASAFFDSGLESLTVPAGVKNVASSAFGACDKLTQVTILSADTVIDPGAFERSEAITTVTLPGTQPLATLFAASKEAVTTVTVGEGSQTVAPGFATGFTALSELVLPEGLTAIGAAAFSGCTGLQTVTVPKSVTAIAEDAFAGAENLTLYGYLGSAAESYAAAQNIPFVALDATQVAPGDVDGDGSVTSTDARLVLQFAAGKIQEADLNTAVASVDGDEAVTSTDARLILQFAAGKLTAWPTN